MSVWPSPIGSARAHADGNGFNIQLETVPLDGRIAYVSLPKKPNNQLGHSNGWRVKAHQPFFGVFYPKYNFAWTSTGIILSHSRLAFFDSRMLNWFRQTSFYEKATSPIGNGHLLGRSIFLQHDYSRNDFLVGRQRGLEQHK